MCELMPSPADVGAVVATDAAGNEVELALDPDGPPVAVVFKTLADPYVGRISLFRVYSGTISAGDTLYNPQHRKDERVIGLSTMFGQKQVEVEEVCAGDIGAMTKLAETMTGDSLSTKADSLVLPSIDFPKPVLAMAILATATGDEEKIVNGLRRIQDEDPSFTIENRAETRQLVISGLGEVQLDVLRAKLRTKYKVDSELAPARVPYRETIRKKVTAQGRHKKQTGGHGQFGDVIIEFEPGESEEFTFEERIFGGSVPKNFHRRLRRAAGGRRRGCPGGIRSSTSRPPCWTAPTTPSTLRKWPCKSPPTSPTKLPCPRLTPSSLSRSAPSRSACPRLSWATS